MVTNFGFYILTHVFKKPGGLLFLFIFPFYFSPLHSCVAEFKGEENTDLPKPKAFREPGLRQRRAKPGSCRRLGRRRECGKQDKGVLSKAHSQLISWQLMPCRNVAKYFQGSLFFKRNWKLVYPFWILAPCRTHLWNSLDSSHLLILTSSVCTSELPVKSSHVVSGRSQRAVGRLHMARGASAVGWLHGGRSDSTPRADEHQNCLSSLCWEARCTSSQCCHVTKLGTKKWSFI